MFADKCGILAEFVFAFGCIQSQKQTQVLGSPFDTMSESTIKHDNSKQAHLRLSGRYGNLTYGFKKKKSQILFCGKHKQIVTN